MNPILIAELLAKNGSDIELIVSTIGLGNILKLAPHIIAIANTYSALQKQEAQAAMQAAQAARADR